MNPTLGLHRCNPIIRFAVSRLPDGFKKLVFLSSLIAHAHNTRDPERHFIENVAKALSPTSRQKATTDSIELPMRLRKVLWGDREILHREMNILMSSTSYHDKLTAATKIADSSPSWFLYASPTAVAIDIANYFANSNTHQHVRQKQQETLLA